MTFIALVEEVRALPIEQKDQLREMLEEEEFSIEAEKKLLEGHLEAMELYRAEKLAFTTGTDEFMRSLMAECSR